MPMLALPSFETTSRGLPRLGAFSSGKAGHRVSRRQVFRLRPARHGPWAMGRRPSAMGDRPSATGRGQWAMGHRPWAMGDGQSAAGNGRWAIGHGQIAPRTHRGEGKPSQSETAASSRDDQHEGERCMLVALRARDCRVTRSALGVEWAQQLWESKGCGHGGVKGLRGEVGHRERVWGTGCIQTRGWIVDRPRAFRLSGFRGFRLSGFPAFGVSGFRGFRHFGLSGSGEGTVPHPKRRSLCPPSSGSARATRALGASPESRAEQCRPPIRTLAGARCRLGVPFRNGGDSPPGDRMRPSECEAAL